MDGNRLLIVEDDPVQRELLAAIFEDEPCKALVAGTLAETRRILQRFQPDIILLDYQLPDGNALELIRELRTEEPRPAVVVITSLSSVTLAVDLIQEGADHFLVKPVEPGALLALCRRLMDQARLRQNSLAENRLAGQQAFNPFAGASAAIKSLEIRVKQVLGVDVPILLNGETGTGKSALARWVHTQSRRSAHAFVELNCAGLNRELLESELFGHEKGSFTGAGTAKVGMMELADRGTLFLDEIAEMDLQVQAKILKAIEEQTFRRLGDTRDRSVAFGLIGATHHDLEQLLPQGRFREDLYYRISTVQLTMPALRDRREDIPLLAGSFLVRIAARWGTGPLQLSTGAAERLQEHTWPGNIRELRNVLERAVLTRKDSTILPSDLNLGSRPPIHITPPLTPTGQASKLTLQAVERQHIMDVMQELNFQVGPAAEALGIPRSTLYVKLKTHGIPSSRIQK